MYNNLAKEPDHDKVIPRPERASTCASSTRSNEEIIKQGNVWKIVRPTGHKNNQSVTKIWRKASKQKKQVSHIKAVYFSTQDQRPRDVPELLKKANLKRKQLEQTRSNHQTDLKAIEQRIANSRARLLNLHTKIVAHLGTLARYQTRLLSVIKDLSLIVGLKMEHAAEVYERLTRFDTQCMSLMKKMTKPQWNKQHCFYMLAVERFREKKHVKQLIDIAETMSENIAITAVANHSVKQHKQALASYQKLIIHRSILEEKHSAITKKLKICSYCRADYVRLLWMMKNKTCSRKVKEKMLKTERLMSADNVPTSESLATPKDFSWNFKKLASGNFETVEEDHDEDDKTFWQNVDIKEFIIYIDELLNERPEDFAFSNGEEDETTNKILPVFQHNRNSLDELYHVSQPSDEPCLGKPGGSSYGLSSSIDATPDRKKVKCFLAPTSPGSSCTSSTEVEVPASSNVGVETIPSPGGDWKQPQDYITSCQSDWSILNEILEEISVARKDHKICFTKLKIITEKIEAVDVEVNRRVSEMETSGRNTPSSTASRIDAAKNLIDEGSVKENTKYL